MKSDMGGAAAVFGAVEAAARLQLPIKISAAIPLADNAIGERAFRPGDVIQSYSGRTIEILDTDAEGRLILADGLHYLKRNYSPDILINLATLTGSSVRTFGYHCAALFSNNDELSVALRQAGDRSGERLWPLPLWDDYKEDIQSDMADVRNFSGKPIAGAISAAKFLEYFIDEHPRWAHLDIAGVAFGQSELSVQKSASGFGVRLLIDFFRSFL
jgi:leucyl aminopeptidase